MVFAQQLPNQEQQDLSNAMGPPPKPPKKKGLFGGGLSLDLGGHKKPDEVASSGKGKKAAKIYCIGKQNKGKGRYWQAFTFIGRQNSKYASESTAS